MLDAKENVFVPIQTDAMESIEKSQHYLPHRGCARVTFIFLRAGRNSGDSHAIVLKVIPPATRERWRRGRESQRQPITR